MPAAPTETDLATEWETHYKAALKKFLLNAVVIDDKPNLPEQTNGPQEAAEVDDPSEFTKSPSTTDSENQMVDEESLATSAKPEIAVSETRAQSDGPLQKNDEASNKFDIRAATNAFAEAGISCSFLLPEDGVDEKTIKKQASKMLAATDLAIVDWFLRDRTSNLAKQILETVLEKDKERKGQLRLICIYTSQDLDNVQKECLEIVKKTISGATPESNDRIVSAEGFRLVIIAKGSVEVSDLPDVLIERFAPIADGLLPAFVFNAIAAFRLNTHHLVTQFSSDLDAAYVANRLITDPPGEVSELMRELFMSECDAAIGLEKVADRCLEIEPLEEWIKYKVDLVDIQKCNSEDAKILEHSVDKEIIISLLKNGFNTNTGKNKIKGHPRITFSENSRKFISWALHGKDFNEVKKNETRFARLIALKREAYGNSILHSEENWLPTLTLGTILMHNDDDENPIKYFYCLTPICNTIRISNTSKLFSFIELEKNERNPDLLIAGGNEETLMLSRVLKTPVIYQDKFMGNSDVGRVLAKKSDTDEFKFNFHSRSGKQYQWLGEMRNGRAQRDLSELAKHWMNFGIKDSEYLRLSSKKGGFF